jgi:hypothetical protein
MAPGVWVTVQRRRRRKNVASLDSGFRRDHVCQTPLQHLRGATLLCYTRGGLTGSLADTAARRRAAIADESLSAPVGDLRSLVSPAATGLLVVCAASRGHLQEVDAEAVRLLAYVYGHLPGADCGRIRPRRIVHLVGAGQAQLDRCAACRERRNVTLGQIAMAESEPYVTRSDLAAKLCVSVKTVDRWVSQGMPSETWGLRSRRFRVSLALAWLRQRERCADGKRIGA